MSTYVVTIPGDEDAWEARTPEERRAVDHAHSAFSTALAERGHTVVTSVELSHSRYARVARLAGDDVTITNGPYAETVEQIGGLYVVETSDVDDLMKLVTELARTERAVEVRPTVDHAAGTS
jgi:hypothetical protein